MNFQEAFWFTRHQQYHQNTQPINPDPTTRNKPRSMNSHSLSFSLQDDVDNDRFPDHDDQQSTTTTAIHNNNNNRAQDYSYIVDREPMFEKPLTPSDVGKLNRLVIPKQHAEKYFPLNGSGGGDGESSGEKGLVLSFDDESGKTWRFRYSYWNSSQSYVLTKGWSRFVKEKKLDAGDVVLFDRHRLELDKFFIGWRRRGVGGGAGTRTAISANSAVVVQGGAVTAAPPCRSGGGWGAANMYYNAPPNHPQLQGYPPLTHCIPVSTYQPQQAAAGGGGGGGDYLHLRTGTTGVENEKAPAAAAAACGSKKISRRRLRLFGVNLECHQEEDVDCSAEPQASDASSLSSGGGGGGTRGGSASASTSANTTNYPTPAAAAAASSSYYHNNNYNNSYYDYVGYPS